MREIFRLAIRNIKEHKSKSLIIAFFIIFGSAIVILGNSFMESVNRGLEKDFRNNYTGDIAISAIPPKGSVIDIFTMTSTSMALTGQIPQIPALTDREKIEKVLSETEGIKSQTKLVSSQVLILMANDEIDLTAIVNDDDLEITDLPLAVLFAGDSSSYFKTFPGQKISEGRYPSDSQAEVLLDERIKAGYERTYGKELKLGDKVLVMGANTKGVIREATVCGFYTPANEYSAMFQCVYASPDLARSFADLTYGSSLASQIEEVADTSISQLSEEDLFSDEGDFFNIDDDGSALLSSEDIDFENILGDTSLRDELNLVDQGSWQFVLLKCSNPFAMDKMVSQLNEKFQAEGINAQVMNWKAAARSYTSSVEGIDIFFNTLIIVLAIVVFFIIMNTMIVSVIERTSEIGTMRAIGAEKKFVRRLFFTESLILTLGTSLIGTLIAVIFACIFNSCNIALTNEIAKMILGGGQLHFSLTPQIIISTIAICALVGILSNLYPVASALKITPLKALSKGSD